MGDTYIERTYAGRLAVIRHNMGETANDYEIEPLPSNFEPAPDLVVMRQGLGWELRGAPGDRYWARKRAPQKARSPDIPSHYRPLPHGVICKCPHMLIDDGATWCCNAAATPYAAGFGNGGDIAGAMPKPEPVPQPDDGWEWAMVEIMGHRKHAGRVREVERFGTKLMRVDVPIDGDPAKGWETHFYPGTALFSYTPTDEASVMRANKPYEPPARYRLAGPDDHNDEDYDDRLED